MIAALESWCILTIAAFLNETKESYMNQLDISRLGVLIRNF